MGWYIYFLISTRDGEGLGRSPCFIITIDPTERQDLKNDVLDLKCSMIILLKALATFHYTCLISAFLFRLVPPFMRFHLCYTIDSVIIPIQSISLSICNTVRIHKLTSTIFGWLTRVPKQHASGATAGTERQTVSNSPHDSNNLKSKSPNNKALPENSPKEGILSASSLQYKKCY